MSLATLREESKQTVRRPIGKVKITFSDPLIDVSLNTVQTENNRISYPIQVADTVTEVPKKWFHTNDTDVVLDGTFFPMPSTLLKARKSQVGWWGTQNADANGEFLTNKPTISLNFTKRLVKGFTVAGDNMLNEWPVDFDVLVSLKTGPPESPVYIPLELKEVRNNNERVLSVFFENNHFNAAQIKLIIHKWNTPGKIVKIVEFYSAVIETFESDEILYMNILQEFESSEGTLPVGNISCNEVDLKLQNITDRFFSENTNSDIHNLIRRNRKIEPFIGFQYKDGSKEWIPKGLYWTGDWAVSDIDTGAQTSARDRFELMRKKDFPYETVFPSILDNVSLKFLITTVLDSLFDYMYDFYYDIDDLDDTYKVEHFDPEFFKKKSYFKVIKELTAASLAYAYMDTPTAADIIDNGPLCKDMLRIKKVSTVFPENPVMVDAIDITKDDFLDKNQPANTESMANVIKVVYKVFTPKVVDPGEPEEWEDEEKTHEEKDENSILEYGEMDYEYKSSDLIQDLPHATAIAESLLVSFKVPKRDIEVQTFGDITLELANQISIPEYQKHRPNLYGKTGLPAVDKRGIFAITKLNSQYDGSLRIALNGRKLRDDTSEITYLMVQDTDGATTKWQDTDGATLKYQDTGVE